MFMPTLPAAHLWSDHLAADTNCSSGITTGSFSSPSLLLLLFNLFPLIKSLFLTELCDESSESLGPSAETRRISQFLRRKWLTVLLVLRCSDPYVRSASSLTVVWDDGPGHGRGVDASDHPEHAQPAQMLSSLLPGQHLREVREHYRHRSTNPADTEHCGEFCTPHSPTCILNTWTCVLHSCAVVTSC